MRNQPPTTEDTKMSTREELERQELRDLLSQRIQESGCSTTEFAELVLRREATTVRKWLTGKHAIPQRVVEFLREPTPAPWPRG